MVKSTLARGLQKCLSKEWMGDNFSDFRVVVDGSEYFCHKFILSACSTFFKGLLRTNFKENLEQRVELNDMSKETFDVIINAVYKGIDGLTKDNIISVWQATHLLDIPFLIEECERFVVENMSLENYITYYHTSKLLHSETVINFTIGFMAEKFEHFRQTETFLELPFPTLFSIVDDDSLNVKSEDLVLESIIKWVSYIKRKPEEMEDIDHRDMVKVANNLQKALMDRNNVDQSSFQAECENINVGGLCLKQHNNGETTNSLDIETLDRKKCLAELVSTARTFLASRSYLEKLLIDPLIMTCVEAHEKVYEALLYQSRSVSFPSNFVIPYRNCSGKRNVMAFLKNEKLNLLKLNSEIIFTLDLELDTRLFQTLASTESTICFAYQGSESHCEHSNMGYLVTRPAISFCKSRYIATYDTDRKLSIVCEACEHSKLNLVSLNGVFVRIISSTTSLHRSNQNIFSCSQFVYNSNYDSVCVFQDNILLFSSRYNNSKPIVNVHCYNIYTKSTQDVNFEGPADHIVSFSCGARKTFILQKNGALRSVHMADDSKIEFTFVSQLWNNFEWFFNGAVYYKKELTLFCSKKPEDVDSCLVKSLPGFMGRINVVEIESESNLVPLVVPESWLTLT